MADRYHEAVGRRKRATARVRITAGAGAVKVNSLSAVEYFKSVKYAEVAATPLKQLGYEKKYDVSVRVVGGGKSAQADAVKMGLARALVLVNEADHKTLSKLGLLKRDPREKERKKYGLKRARKAPQFTKR